MTPTIADAPFPKQPFLYDYGTTFHSSKTRSFVLNKLQAYHSPKTAQIRKTTANLGKDGLAASVLDCATQALHEGDRGDEALTKAAGDALLERAASGGRQVEEHWLRESSARSATLVRSRIDSAIAASNMSVLAKRCIGCADAAAPRGPTKKTGIDDGVSLP